MALTFDTNHFTISAQLQFSSHMLLRTIASCALIVALASTSKAEPLRGYIESNSSAIQSQTQVPVLTQEQALQTVPQVVYMERKKRWRDYGLLHVRIPGLFNVGVFGPHLIQVATPLVGISLF